MRFYQTSTVYIFCIFCISLVRSRRYHHDDYHIRNHDRKNEIPHYETQHANQHYATLRSKKAEIEGAIHDIESDLSEHKNKRGFLANLANLLNDAELLSGHKNVQSGLSSVTLTDPNNQSKDEENVATKKEEIIPTTDEVKKALKETTKDFAPIFAMVHGKIIPLGKLPDTAFKKSHTEEPPSQTAEKTSESRDVNAARRTLPDEKPAKEQETKSKATIEKKDNDEEKLSKLQKYLKNLDGHIPATGASKEVRGVAKDEVVFPDDETGSPKSDIMKHVKSVVLDTGKVLSVNGNHLESGEESKPETSDTATPESQQKFIVSDDGSLTPLTKSKEEIGEAVTRDTTGGSEGQKTVALSLDVLKDLLKKSDNKVSLAALLNKSPETKSDTPKEDEDPGTIEDFAAGGLKAHNMYRGKHHDESLIWSDDLAAKAQKLAEALADKKTLEISKDLEKDGYGENVAKVWAKFKNAGEAATKMWYSQSENYHFDDPHLDENTGQFAQVIWQSTKELGMGVAKSIDDVNNDYVYVTALYKPPGNIEAALRKNVLPTGNNTVDVYTTFFKRGGVVDNLNAIRKRSKLERRAKRLDIIET
ncbi:uncharacterized protein LOC130645285 [Hydractinia symbiolongicarpus]|uniref:uncharacterized protein LOC130645285 n=1 Tax=Hydractinia symbiolongicarpus TaxID=13093 RepID=UPI00254E80F8|nr:uncharacterized protein LOC130645285 [Hydractinia symbiolongicarpus]